MSELPLVAPVPQLRTREFEQIRTFAFETFGLDLRQGRECLVSARLGKHLRAGGFRSFEDYFQFVKTDKTGTAVVGLIDALTTNHTSFLREQDHFTFLVTKVLPEWKARRSVNIWSAACSTGEEPYSILLTLLDAIGNGGSPEVHVRATDISSKVLDVARQGMYSQDRVELLPKNWLSSFFIRTGLQQQRLYQVRPELRSKIEFARFNLMNAVPGNWRFQLVFCRNVMIYFNKTTQAALINRLANSIEPGGYLFVGHAESLTGIDHSLKYIRPAIYRKAS